MKRAAVESLPSGAKSSTSKRVADPTSLAGGGAMVGLLSTRQMAIPDGGLAPVAPPQFMLTPVQMSEAPCLSCGAIVPCVVPPDVRVGDMMVLKCDRCNGSTNVLAAASPTRQFAQEPAGPQEVPQVTAAPAVTAARVGQEGTK